MNKNIKIAMQILLIVGLFGLFIWFLLWATIADFGKQTGVFITQTVKSNSISDSTYEVYTDVWYSPNWIEWRKNTIEWQGYKLVKCYQVEREKKDQYARAIIEQAKVRDYLKSIGNKICNP
jgi:hypothetical protein